MSTDCLNCGATLHGPYCAQCGQKHIPQQRWSLKHLLGDVVEQLSDLDNRTFRTLRETLIQPGLVARRYSHGQRARYTSPIKLLLVAFFVFFLYPFLSDFSLPLPELLRYSWFTDLAKQQVADMLASGNWTETSLHEAFAERQGQLVSSMVFLHVPFFALVLWFLHFRRQASLVFHLVVAAYFLLFLMLYFLLISALVVLPLNLVNQWLGWTASETTMEILRWLLLRLPMILAIMLLLRQAYRQSWWATIAKSLLVLPGLFAMHMIYRTLMLYTTLFFL